MERLTGGYGLIEGPLWAPEHGGLLFSDVTFGGVFAVTDEGTVSTVFEHRRGIGGMALHADGGLVVSGRNIAVKPFDGGPTIEVFAAPPESEGIGFNDLTTDAAGRIYAGSLGASPFAEDGGTVPGHLWLIDLDGSARPVAGDVLLTNGLGFSPDARTLYHSDSSREAVMKYAVHDDGSLGPKELFAEVDDGVPDGLVVSEDGAVWVALARGGAGVAVLNPDGTHRTHLPIPEPMCTSVCFGGDDRRRLYIVSGSDGVDSDRAGAVHVIDTEVAGLPVAPARVTLNG